MKTLHKPPLLNAPKDDLLFNPVGEAEADNVREYLRMPDRYVVHWDHQQALVAARKLGIVDAEFTRQFEPHFRSDLQYNLGTQNWHSYLRTAWTMKELDMGLDPGVIQNKRGIGRLVRECAARSEWGSMLSHLGRMADVGFDVSADAQAFGSQFKDMNHPEVTTNWIAEWFSIAENMANMRKIRIMGGSEGLKHRREFLTVLQNLADNGSWQQYVVFANSLNEIGILKPGAGWVEPMPPLKKF